MLTLTSLNITSYDIDKLTLTWEFATTVESLSDYEIEVYRSESPGISGITDYDLIASGISATDYSYIDTSVTKLYDHNRTWYYKLKLTDTVLANTDIQPEPPAYRKGVSTDKVLQEIVRRKSITLSPRYSGRSFYILKKRNYGTHCSECWEETQQRITISNCTNCYGTGWEDGYFTPIPLTAMINASPKYNQITMFGMWMPADVLLTMLNYPPVRERDILIDDNNKRWMIKQVRPTEKGGVLIEQNAQCTLVAFDDPIYDLLL